MVSNIKVLEYVLVFIDSLHWCTGTHKNIENSAKYLGSFSDIFLLFW
jgi:hypothetical protein